MRGWKDLGVVETIYEDEDEDSSNSPSVSPTLSSPPTPLQTRVDAWSLATGLETDVLIHVQDLCFNLHKNPLMSRSGYLKRHLTEPSEITLSPPLNITPETFSLVADFCYGSHIVITPFNVAALRVAAELLDMTEQNGAGDENLRQKTETYFSQAVSVNRECAAIVLRSCFSLLPEAEETAFLASRCIEALAVMDRVDSLDGWIDDVKSLAADEFQMIADSMHERFTRTHDLLYRIVDLYLKEHKGKITDEQKTRICSSVDCSKLSAQLLMHAVQNPRMPLRFIVRAMFVEQLNNRHSIFSAAAATDHHQLNTRHSVFSAAAAADHHQLNTRHSVFSAAAAADHHPRRLHNGQAATLGAILQHDAALRQVTQLKEAMEVTGSRIQSLERDLDDMKKLLRESENRRKELESSRAASFRLSSENKVVRGQRGSTSLASLPFYDRQDRRESSSSEKSCNENSLRNEKSFRWKLIHGLKSAFRTSSPTSKQDTESRVSSRVEGNDGGDVIVIKEDRPSHRRSRSLV
ncbi:hypothetical protein HHK36_002748 [Tetracentron sinense]|uniref:Uncharacterized protein n=1 Tax=Tetracentron sinense TaxID=13715 RepID=A0A834ZMR6_TETSI|nr:hypothetical protein HHK36_002748 [Tetracentron sinense]